MPPKARRPTVRGRGKDQPPVPVTVVPVASQDVPVYLTALGTVQARNTVTVRPQVGGQLMKLNFQEGQEVKKGDVIAEIDPRTIQSQYDQSVAKLKQDQALAATAKNNLDRSTNLVSKGGQQYVSKQDLDNLKNSLDQAVATANADQAAIRAAQVQLGFTKVIAPIDGLAGIRSVDAGNIVATTDAIVTLTELHPIYVMFYLPEKNLDLVRGSNHRRLALRAGSLRTRPRRLARHRHGPPGRPRQHHRHQHRHLPPALAVR